MTRQHSEFLELASSWLKSVPSSRIAIQNPFSNWQYITPLIMDTVIIDNKTQTQQNLLDPILDLPFGF